MNFAAIDWIIVAVYLAASMLVGLLGRKYVGNTAHFLVAGRELGTYTAVAIVFVVIMTALVTSLDYGFTRLMFYIFG